MSYILDEIAGEVDLRTWQLQEAKNRLSEVIERAHTDGPQTIARHGQPRAVLLSIEEYRSITSDKPDFRAWLLGGPKVDDLDLERSRDTGREIDL